jgi:hypothetical protein
LKKSTCRKHSSNELTPDDKKNIKAVINIDSIAQKGDNNPQIFTINGKGNFAVTLLKTKPKVSGELPGVHLEKINKLWTSVRMIIACYLSFLHEDCTHGSQGRYSSKNSGCASN